MLTYTIILLASLVLAVVIRWLYSSFTDSSHSVYSSKASTPIAHAPLADPVVKPVQKGAAYQPKRWPEKEHYVREPQPAVEPLDSATGHCSLYAAKTQSKSTRKQGISWPQREDKLEPAGKSYKVTRKTVTATATATANAGPDASDKPWGW